jgi:hypothetical protein
VISVSDSSASELSSWRLTFCVLSTALTLKPSCPACLGPFSFETTAMPLPGRFDNAGSRA